MITLLHGDDIASSRNALQEEKAKHTDKEVVTLYGKSTGIAELTLATDSDSLFAIPKLIIIENLLKGPPSKEKTAMLEHVSGSLIHEIILWEDRKIQAGVLKKYFSKARVSVFDFPAQLFKFLDSLSPNNTKNIISGFHNLLKKEEAELIFVMLIRQFRYMIMTYDSKETVAELPSWQAHKFRHQATLFSLENLISCYRQLIAIDYRIKTGQTPLSVREHLDLFFITL